MAKLLDEIERWCLSFEDFKSRDISSQPYLYWKYDFFFHTREKSTSSNRKEYFEVSGIVCTNNFKHWFYDDLCYWFIINCYTSNKLEISLTSRHAFIHSLIPQSTPAVLSEPEFKHHHLILPEYQSQLSFPTWSRSSFCSRETMASLLKSPGDFTTLKKCRSSRKTARRLRKRFVMNMSRSTAAV